MVTDGNASAASGIEVGSINPATQEPRATAAKQAYSCVARAAWCWAWRLEGVSPYVGIRTGGIASNYGGPLGLWLAKKRRNTVESQAE